MDIEVGIYSDRIEVISHAALQNSMTIEKMKAKSKADYATLARILDVSSATVKRHIQKLKSVGRLKRIGSKKVGY